MGDIYILASDDSYVQDPYLRESHNCYSYFLNLKDPSATALCKKTYTGNNLCRRSQPGYAAGYPSLQTKDFNCPEIVKRTLADNPEIYETDKEGKCEKEYYKGAIVVAPEHDYHYYRLNDDLVYYNGKEYKDVWTHKPGYKPNTFLDAKGQVITDPEKASRDYGSLNYKNFCTYTCLPRDPTRKKMRMFNESDNSSPLNNTVNALEGTVKNIVHKRNKGGALKKRKTRKRRNIKLNVKKSNKLY
jgi:hypothetical protein